MAAASRPTITHRYIVLYKPKGYVTTRSDPEGRRTVMDLIGEGAYIYPVGRLDYDSEGLLLMMTDGDLAARLMHPRHEVDKVYEVIVMGTPDPRAHREAAQGRLHRGRPDLAGRRPRRNHRQGRPADDAADHHHPRRPKPPDPQDVQRRGPARAGFAPDSDGSHRVGPPQTWAMARSDTRGSPPAEKRRLETSSRAKNPL